MSEMTLPSRHRTRNSNPGGLRSSTLPLNKQTITLGETQGSILGPFLFLIHLNDSPFTSKIFRFIIYADDTTLIANLSDFKQSK